MQKLLLTICLLAATLGFAQSPGITVTGTLKDAQGNPNAGTVTFTLVNHGSGPATVGGTYTITNDVTTVQAAGDGTFSVTLFGNYQIDQGGTFYSLAFTTAGSQARNSTARYQFSVPGVFDISALVPYTSAIGGPVALPGYMTSAGAATITARWAFNVSPTVPTPSNSTDAANKSYVDTNAGTALLGTTNSWSQPQAFGANCPTATSGVNAIAVNGVVNAACFSGADWVVKVNAAAASLPAQGGTVFIPASLSGGTSSNGVTVPAGASLLFDAGTFTTGGALTINGAGHKIEGQSPDATILVFSGATDGVYFPDASPAGKRTVIRGLSLYTSNASGGKAFNAFDASTIPPTNIVMENVKITHTGSGRWAYGFHTSNMQFCSFRDVTITGAVTVGLHLENGTNEDVFENLFVINGGTTRAAEITDGAINSSEVTFVGGGFQGSGSVYVHNSYMYAVGTHYEAITPTGSDTSAIIFDSANARWSSVNGGGVTMSIQNSANVKITSSQAGDITVDSTSQGGIVNSSYKSLTNSSRAFDDGPGNSTFAGGATKRITVGDFQLTNDTGNGQVIFSRLGTSAFAITQGVGARITLGSGFALGWASSGILSEDTFLSRSAAGSLKLGTTNGGSDGTFKLGSLLASVINARCQASGITATAGIQECITTLSSQGGVVEVPAGTYTTTACINLPAGTPSLHIRGAGMTGVAAGGTGTTIQNSTTDLICGTGSLHGVEIDGMVLDSKAGGGHIFNFTPVTGAVSQVHIHDVSLIQENTGKSVLTDVQAAGAGCIYGPFVMDNFIYGYAAGNTVPAVKIACDNPNGIVIDKFRANGSATAGNYAVWIENVNTTSGGNGVVVSNGVFEVPQAGAINLLSLTNPVLANNGIFDLSGAPTAILTNVDISAGGFLSNSPSISGHYSLGGTTAFPDIKINATNVYGGKVTDSTLNYLDGGSAAAATGRAIQVLNSRVNNKQNLASLESGLQTNGDLCWYNSSSAHSYCLYQTSAGVLFLKVDGTATALSFNSSGQITSNVTITGNTNLASGTTTLGAVNFSHLFASATAPTISSGFGTSPSITANNGTPAFEINVGTGGTASSGVVGLPTSTNGWNCTCNDITTQSTSDFMCKQTASSTTTATLTEYNTAGAATAWVASDKLRVSCLAY